MLRVIRSTVQSLDIDADREDDFAGAAQAGELLRESNIKDKHGQTALDVEVRAYTDPDGQKRFAVLYTGPAEIDCQDTGSYDEARNLYEETVRAEEQGAVLNVDENGQERPVFAYTDVPGVGGYEDETEEAGDAQGYMLEAEWVTVEAEEAQRIAAEKTQARQIAYARAIDSFGRGGQALLARRVGKSEPTVKDIAARGRVLLKEQEDAKAPGGTAAPVSNTYPKVPAGELRVGDVLSPHVGYKGDDPMAGAVYESIEHVNGPYMRFVFRELATGETMTSHLHEDETVHLLRRGPEAPGGAE